MELKGPSEAEVKKFIKLEMKLDIYTTTNQHFRGTLLWADQSAFHIKLENDKTITLLKTAVVYYCTV